MACRSNDGEQFQHPSAGGNGHNHHLGDRACTKTTQFRIHSPSPRCQFCPVSVKPKGVRASGIDLVEGDQTLIKTRPPGLVEQQHRPLKFPFCLT